MSSPGETHRWNPTRLARSSDSPYHGGIELTACAGAAAATQPGSLLTVTDINERNARVIQEFRANAGTVGGPFEGATMLLLHTEGAKSGQPRVNPLVYLPDGERYVIIASKGGSPEDPQWYRNLLADPNAEIEVDTRRIPVRATMITGPERDELYARQVQRRPAFAEYEKRTTRTIPVIALEPIGEVRDGGGAPGGPRSRIERPGHR